MEKNFDYSVLVNINRSQVDDRPLQTMSEAERRAVSVLFFGCRALKYADHKQSRRAICEQVLFLFYKTKPGRTKKMSELASLLRKVGVDGYGSLCRQVCVFATISYCPACGCFAFAVVVYLRSRILLCTDRTEVRRSTTILHRRLAPPTKLHQNSQATLFQ